MNVYAKEHGTAIEFERTNDNVAKAESNYTIHVDKRYDETVVGKDWKGNRYTAKGTVTRLNRKNQIFAISDIKKLN